MASAKPARAWSAYLAGGLAAAIQLTDLQNLVARHSGT